jgi:hypothetical protein
LILFLQLHLINNLEAKFSTEVCNKRVYKTSGTPRFKIIRPDEDADVINSTLQSLYRSGVSILLYLTKYLRPDLCNGVRELAKYMDKATKGTYLEILRLVKFVIDSTRDTYIEGSTLTERFGIERVLSLTLKQFVFVY